MRIQPLPNATTVTAILHAWKAPRVIRSTTPTHLNTLRVQSFERDLLMVSADVRWSDIRELCKVV